MHLQPSHNMVQNPNPNPFSTLLNLLEHVLDYLLSDLNILYSFYIILLKQYFFFKIVIVYCAKYDVLTKSFTINCA